MQWLFDRLPRKVANCLGDRIERLSAFEFWPQPISTKIYFFSTRFWR